MIPEMLEAMLGSHDLPEPLPAEPMAILNAWQDEARTSGKYDDANTMALATATRDGMPSVRIVLCKRIDVGDPALVFFTNYQSRKGQELEGNPRAAAVFHWPHAKRQARVEGTIERISAAESDEYFHSRPLVSRIGAIVSPQSRPIESSTSLIRGALAVAKQAALGKALDRPAHWGGYRLKATAVELWSARTGRLHQRGRWSRVNDSLPAEWRVELLAP